MSNGTIDFIGFWAFVISIVFVGLQIYFNWRSIKAQLEIAQKQNETQIQIAREQFETQREIAKQQFKQEVLSRNRQEWINTLREETAQFVSATLILSMTPQPDSDEENWQEFLENIRSVETPAARIQLLLNLEEDDHKHINQLIEEIIELTASLEVAKSEKAWKGKLDQINGKLADLMDVSPKVLKREWERVKRGE